MALKLTSREYRVIVIAVVVSAAALAVSVKYFYRAFPEASIDFRVNRNDSEPLAREFLAGRGVRLDGYRHAAVFDFSEPTKLYLERSKGLDRTNELAKGPVRLWRWSHRWFKPQQKEEYRVEVTPAGEVVGFEHEIAESATGANLDAAPARELAESFLREARKRDLHDLEFVETETEKRPARTDHSFTWKQKSVDLGEGSLRVGVEVDGDQVAGYREYVKIPEQWTRDYEKLRSRNTSAQVVDQVFWALLSVAMLVILVLRLRDRDAPVRLSFGFGLVTAALYFLGQLNDFPVAEFGYRTTDSYSSFIAGYFERSVLSALGVGAWIFLLVAGSEPVYREGFPRFISIRRYLSWQGLRTRSFFMANVVGIALTFFFFAYQTIFYLTANRLGAWAPSDVNYSDLLNTRVPWVWVLFGGFLPAVSEEMQFRAFAIPFLKKLLRSWPLALVLAAFNWGFLHSAYPNQPFFIRGLEVGVGGIVTGLVMLRFGIVATLIWHYSVDALYTAFLLLRSHNHYLMISGGVTAGIMLVPLVMAVVVYWRSGTFTDEETLTNAREGLRRGAREAPIVGPKAALAYRPLEGSRLLLAGCLAAVFSAIAFVPAERFGEGIKLQTTKREAIRVADDFLKARQAPVSDYRRVAWMHENVDRFALRYLLERRTVAESDRIYRQATRLLLWEVRYFKPLEKEEHLVFVDAETGKIFAYRHILDENAPGASLSAEAARALAGQALEREGYKLSDFELQESQGQKRKAREDYTLVWQAKAGDPRNVGDAHYRLEVEIAGDQVAGISRFIKVPEEWMRERAATRLPNQVLMGLEYLLLSGLVSGGLLLFVKQLRGGQIPWRGSVPVAAVVAAASAASAVNQLSQIYRQYDTSIPLNSFRLLLAAGLILEPLIAGLAAWLLVGVAASFYPQVWGVFRGSWRRVWRRDAAVATVISLAAGAASSRLSLVVASRFHAFAPVKVGLSPGPVEAYSPAADIFVQALIWSVFSGALAALVIFAVRLGLRRRAWWFWLGGILLLVNLGPAGAHSAREFALGWATRFAALAVAVGIVALFFRDNPLAYLGAAFAGQVSEPLVALLSEPAGFLRWNALVLALLAAVVLGWMLLAGGESKRAANPAA